MAVNRDKLVYCSGDAIDKIVANRVVRTIYNDGNTGGDVNWQRAKIVSKDFPNPYGEQCFVRGRWNIDGGEWNTFESQISSTFSINLTGFFPQVQKGAGLLAACSIGVSKDAVRIVTANGHHGDVFVDTTTNFQSYTPIGHTFNVEYELFEV